LAAIPGVAEARGVYTSIVTFLRKNLQAGIEEFPLQQRLAIGKGDPALFSEIGLLALGDLQDALGSQLLPPDPLLRIWVVAVGAAQGTALEKEDRSGPRAVHQTHGFNGVYVAAHQNSPYTASWNVLLITSSW